MKRVRGFPCTADIRRGLPSKVSSVVRHISAEQIHRHMTSVAVHNKSKTNYKFTHACSHIDTVNNHVHT